MGAPIMDTRTGTDISYAAGILRDGGIVAIPTETVYGLAGNALDPDAVLSIFRAKNRPFFDPLIVHTHDIAEISKYVTSIPEALLPLMERFMPGPLTVLLPRRAVIPDIVTSGLERVAVRIPSHPVALELLRMLDFPLAAPSANPFGYISPTQAGHVAAQLGGVIPYILDGGPCDVGVESTIVGMEGDRIMVYRHGGVTAEQIEATAGDVVTARQDGSQLSAPGMMLAHYAPRKPMLVGDVRVLLAGHMDREAAVLSFSRSYDVQWNYILSPEGSVDIAAKRLFAGMRALDDSPADIIIAESLPETGLGRAVNDRLRRASVNL